MKYLLSLPAIFRTTLLLVLIVISTVSSCVFEPIDDQTDDNEDEEIEESISFDELPPANLGGQDFSQFSQLNRWQKPELTYYIHNFALEIPEQRQKEIFATAFGEWAKHSSLSFKEVFNKEEADLVLGFGSSHHCQLYDIVGERCRTNSRFFGQGGVLAHCYFPGSGLVSGDAHFDSGEYWSELNSGLQNGESSLLSVAMHEIGHGLGLDHSNDRNALMFDTYVPSDIKISLSSDDIARIQALYGPNNGTPPPTGPASSAPDVIPCSNTSSNGDADADGVHDDFERFVLGSDPLKCDTDGDGLADIEAAYGLNPLNPDTDGDGVNDGDELIAGTNPLIPDQGGNGTSFIGKYRGFDSFGSPFHLTIISTGEVKGELGVFYNGIPITINMYGVINNQGNLSVTSNDRYFTFFGQVASTGRASGGFQTARGAVGTWAADWYMFKKDDESDVLEYEPGENWENIAKYSPVSKNRKPTTHPIYNRVE